MTNLTRKNKYFKRNFLFICQFFLKTRTWSEVPNYIASLQVSIQLSLQKKPSRLAEWQTDSDREEPPPPSGFAGRGLIEQNLFIYPK